MDTNVAFKLISHEQKIKGLLNLLAIYKSTNQSTSSKLVANCRALGEQNVQLKSQVQKLEGEIALNIQTNGTVSQLKSTLEQRIDQNEQMSDRIKV